MLNNRPLKNTADYLSYFNYQENEANPMLDHLSDDAWLNTYASEYRPFLIQQLLSSLSPGLTYTYLNRLNYNVFNNVTFRNALTNIKINLNDYFNAEVINLGDALNHLDKIIKNIPPVIQLHVSRLNELKNLFHTDKTANSNFSTWLKENNANGLIATPFPSLLRSIEDIDTLLSISLAEYRAQSWLQKKKPLRFLDTLIDFEIKACQLLQVQIEALQCSLTKPAQTALDAFKQCKEKFDSITLLPEMNIETAVLRLRERHKNRELLTKLRDVLSTLLTMQDQWHEVRVQHEFLEQLPETYKTDLSYRLTWKIPHQRIILQGMFNAPPTNREEFSEKIQGFINSLNVRIDMLANPNDLVPNTPLPALPLLSLTSLLIDNPDRIYLLQEPDVCLNELEQILSGSVFIPLDSELSFITPLSTKEMAAVVFEINLLILLNKFSHDIRNFCETVATPYLSGELNSEPLSLAQTRKWSNQYHYFAALSIALLEQLACLKHTCQTYLVRVESRLQWPQLKLILSQLTVVENSTHEHSFILASFKVRLAQHSVVANKPFHTLLLDLASDALERAQPLEAAEHLNQFYRDTEGFQQSELVQTELSNLEKRVVGQLVKLLHQSHRLLFLATPLEILFNADSHPHGHTFIQSLNAYTEKLTLLVEHSLLDGQHSLWSRSKTYARWLHVAEQLYTRSDFLGHLSITVGLDTVRELESAIACLDEQTSFLFKNHVKFYKDCMPSVFTSLTRNNIAAIPHLEHFLTSIVRLSEISNERGTIGYLKKKDARLYRGYDAQVIYRLYEAYHRTLLEELSQDNVLFSDWQRYLERVYASQTCDSYEIRAQARIIESTDKKSLDVVIQSQKLRQHTSSGEQDTTTLLHLAEQLRQDYQLAGSINTGENNIFADNRYIRLTALADTPHALAAKLMIHSALPIRLDAYRLGLFANLTALEALFTLLKEDRFHSIREIDLHGNETDPQRINTIANALQKIAGLIAPYETINLSNNQIMNISFGSFVDNFPSFPHQDHIRLQRLSLQNNKLGVGNYGQAGFYLPQFLTRYRNLTHLDLNQNFLSERDAKPLAEALLFSTKLREIDLGMNPWGDTGIQLLCNTFSLLTSLEVVKFFCCKLTDGSRDTIATLIHENKTILRVLFDGNDRDTYSHHQDSLHCENNQTTYDNNYTGMSNTSCMYLKSLLRIRQNDTVEKAGLSMAPAWS